MARWPSTLGPAARCVESCLCSTSSDWSSHGNRSACPCRVCCAASILGHPLDAGAAARRPPAAICAHPVDRMRCAPVRSVLPAVRARRCADRHRDGRQLRCASSRSTHDAARPARRRRTPGSMVISGRIGRRRAPNSIATASGTPETATAGHPESARGRPQAAVRSHTSRVARHNDGHEHCDPRRLPGRRAQAALRRQARCLSRPRSTPTRSRASASSRSA